MTKSLCLLITSFLLISFSFTFAQTDAQMFSPEVVDARTFAMGNTQVLSAKGSNALFSNAARLSTLSKMQIEVGGRAFFGSISNDEWDQDEHSNREAGYSFHPKLTNISFAMPIKLKDSSIKLAIGGGFYNYFDYSANYYYERTSENSKSETDRFYGGGLSMIALGGAINFAEIFNVGLTFNTSIIAERTMEKEYKYDGEKTESEQEHLFENVSFFTLSAYVNATPELHLGLFIRPGFDLKGDKVKTKDDEGNTETEELNEKLSLPTYYGLGIGYQISPTFLVNAEYQNRPFSDIENNGEEASEFIDNGHCFRVGAEVLAGKTPLRFGFFMDDLFLPKESKDTAPASIMGVTAGIGFAFSEKFLVDFGAQYNSYTYERTEGYDNDKKIYEHGYTFYKFMLNAKILLN